MTSYFWKYKHYKTFKPGVPMEYLDETKDMYTCSDLFISYKTCSQVTS